MIVLSVKTSHCGIIKAGRNFYFLKESKKEKEKCSECNITFKVLFNENNHICSNFFLSILQEKIYFFYFTHPLLQNTHISLFILHIYSKKYSFFYIFIIFSLMASLSLRPNHYHHHPTTIKSKPRSSRPKLCDFFISHSHG